MEQRRYPQYQETGTLAEIDLSASVKTMSADKRDIYLAQLINARQNGLIKVVTGLRRCGKSYLLMTLFHNHQRRFFQDNHHCQG